MKVTTLKAKVKRIWVEVPGDEEGAQTEKVWVDYRPGELTLEVSDELRAAISTGFESDVAFIMMRRILVSWDLQDAEGEPLGITDEAIKSVPLTFIGLVLQAVEDDSRPNRQRGATSGGSSPQTEPSEASPNGTTSSERPTGSLVSPGNS